MLRSFLSARALVPTLLFVLMSSLIVYASSTFQYCIGEHGYRQLLLCSGEFIHKNGEAIIAVFTVFLVISTILLWVATRDAVRSAEQTSRQVNRAYLACGGPFDTTSRIFSLDVENNGQTPARMLDYDVQTAMPGQVGLQSAMPVNRNHQHWEDTIPPRSRKTISTRVIVPKTVPFVFGCIWYKDVWDEPHCTRFILSVRNDRTWPDATGVHPDYTKTT